MQRVFCHLQEANLGTTNKARQAKTKIEGSTLKHLNKAQIKLPKRLVLKVNKAPEPSVAVLKRNVRENCSILLQPCICI